MTKVWLIDFDDTLATGPVTWGYKRALPKFIKTHDLAADLTVLERNILRAQEKANQSTDLSSILAKFFKGMNWPLSLIPFLLLDVQESYFPELFEDARSFLEALNGTGDTIVILSNNPRAPDSVKELGLYDLVDDIVTPHMLPGAGPKPEYSLWVHMVQRLPEMNANNAVVVGDDPWSDLAFAGVCRLQAWLIDRDDRFAELELAPQVRRVQSLLEIELS